MTSRASKDSAAAPVEGSGRRTSDPPSAAENARRARVARTARASLVFRHPFGLLPRWSHRLLHSETPARGRRDVFLFSPPVSDWAVVLKCYGRPRMARGQHDALREAHRIAGRLVARPLYCDTTSGILALPFYGKPSVQNLLGHRYRDEALALSGRWLRDFHLCSPAETRPFDPDARWDALSRMQLDEDTQAAAGRALGRLRDRARALAGHSVPVVYAFFDFKPSNLLLHGGDPVAIDRPRCGTGPAVMDVARFLVHAHLHIWRKTSDIAAAHAQFQRTCTLFLNAYGPVDRELLDVALDRNWVQLWCAARRNQIRPEKQRHLDAALARISA